MPHLENVISITRIPSGLPLDFKNKDALLHGPISHPTMKITQLHHFATPNPILPDPLDVASGVPQKRTVIDAGNRQMTLQKSMSKGPISMD